MDCSILAALSPIYTMFIAAIAIKEPITLKKAGGVLISLAGAILLILNSVSLKSGGETSKISGLIIMIFNGLSFSLYLGIFKPLISKYSVITFMKWIFLFAALISLPFSFKEIIGIQWSTIPKVQILELGYLIVFATFITYFLIPFGQRRIRPTLVSMYSYIQPIVAIGISIIIGMEIFTWLKVLAALMVFGGVILVSRIKAK
jgi:drug/metabolite transporter (DMT)-like permease